MRTRASHRGSVAASSGHHRGWVAARAGAAVLVLAPLLAALLGVSGPRVVTLNFGPGDAPYIAGFAPEYEIDDKVGTHWTTYHAAVALPLQVSGGPVDLSYRFTRGFGETAQVEVLFDGRAVDQFECRGGTVLERKASLGVLPATPVRVGIESDSHERRDRGLKMDWIRLTLGPGARLRLTGGAARRPRGDGGDDPRHPSPGRLAAPTRARAERALVPWPRWWASSSIPGSPIASCAVFLSRWCCWALLDSPSAPGWRRRGAPVRGVAAHPGRPRPGRVPRPRPRRQPSGLLLSRPAHARAPGREGPGRGHRLLRLALTGDLGTWRVADGGLREDLRVSLHARVPPALHAPARRLRHAAPVPEARRGRRLDRADRPHLGPGPAPRGVRRWGRRCSCWSRPTRRA